MTDYELHQLTDQLAIQRLNARYNWACYERDSVALASCYVEDGVYESGNTGGRHVGHDQLGAALVAARESSWLMGHVTADSLIEVHRDSATQKVFVLLYRRESPDGENEFFGTGTYHDRLVRTTDGWRYAHRLSTIDRSRLPWWPNSDGRTEG